MSKKFDPDKHYVKVRGMGTVHYEQDGCKFNSGRKFIGKLNGEAKPVVEAAATEKKDVRAQARAKINKKKGKGSLDGFREDEAPEAVSSAHKENVAARQAEENV
jgi:hypothetical protein